MPSTTSSSFALPSRSTRGVRVSELVGEAAEADAAFWGVNHEIWKEENDESDDGSYEAEVEKADVFDSDFNDTETEDEEGSDDEKEVKRSQRKDSAKTGKAKNKYKEPTKPIKVQQKKQRVDEEADEDPETIPTVKKAKVKSSIDFGVDRSRRESTQLKTTETNEALLKQSKEKVKMKPVTRTIKTMFNQKDLLLEGLDTEATNAKWLQNQKQMQDEKIESDRIAKSTSSENFIKFSSKRGCFNTITFTSAESMPPIFSRPKPPIVEPKFCAITGLPAKYKDPKTNMYYANVKAFKEIRKRFLKYQNKH